MGYTITINLGDGLFIKSKDVSLLLAKLRTLPNSVNAENILMAFSNNRFNAIWVGDGYLIIKFEGQKSNYGEEDFFKAIAPYICVDSEDSIKYIYETGEDGSLARYCFNGKNVIRQVASCVWN